MIGDDVQMIEGHFGPLNDLQHNRFKELGRIYGEWNEKVNLISRKDIENFYYKHLLHALFITRFVQFSENSQILDAGTGGGIPGIPLAIMFQDSYFTLVDARKKKINAVQDISDQLGLKNVHAVHSRMEDIKGNFDFIVSRAVAPVDQMIKWTSHLRKSKEINPLPNGWIFLKGGDLKAELQAAHVHQVAETYVLNDWIELEGYEDKKLVYIPY